jgi:hypothetical protein
VATFLLVDVRGFAKIAERAATQATVARQQQDSSLGLIVLDSTGDSLPSCRAACNPLLTLYLAVDVPGYLSLVVAIRKNLAELAICHDAPGGGSI